MNIIRRTSLFLALACVALLGACAQGAQPDARGMQMAQEDIQQLHSQFLKAFNAKDASALAATYTDDAVLMPPNYPAVKTQIAIATYARQELVPPVSGMLLNVTETQVTGGDYAFSSGYYTILGDNGATLDHGKFLEVLKHSDQGWKFYRDMYNSDMPAPGAATSMAPAAATH